MNVAVNVDHILEVKYFGEPVPLKLLIGSAITLKSFMDLIKKGRAVSIYGAEMLDGIPNYNITVVLSTEKIQWIKWFEYHSESANLYKRQDNQ